jgi:hypothetical protein
MKLQPYNLVRDFCTAILTNTLCQNKYTALIETAAGGNIPVPMEVVSHTRTETSRS